MGELKKNLKSNFLRYTDGKNKVEYIAKLAMYTALSFVLYAFAKFPLPFIFPSFLDIQLSEIPALIAGFSMGPISGCLVIILKCLLKFPMSSTMFVGEATDILIGCSYIIPSSIIYNCHKSKKTAIIGLIIGSVFVTVVGLISNRIISIPFYVEVMFNGSFEPLLNMLRPLYPSVTMDNFYTWYLLAGILPFNILRCIIVCLVTFILYPRLKRPLKLEVSQVYEKCKKYEELTEVLDENSVEITGKDDLKIDNVLETSDISNITDKEIANKEEK